MNRVLACATFASVLLLAGANVSGAQAAGPSLGTVSATVTGTTAAVTANVDPDGLFTDTHVAYGTTPSLGSESADVSAGSGTTSLALTVPIPDLEPGTTYYYAFVATNSDASVTSATGMFAIGAPALDVTLDPTSFRAARSGPTVTAKYRDPIGTMIGYNDTQQDVTITFAVLAARLGVRSGQSCVAPPKHPRRGVHYRSCTRYVALGSFEYLDTTGVGTVDFSGRIANRALAVGAYELTATPRVANVGGATVTRHFEIVR